MPSRKSQTVLTRLRILAALLLASVAWGSTVEFTHHHSLRNARAATSSEVTSQSGVARLQDGNSPESTSRPNIGSECSICQLQHNLSTTLLSEFAATLPNEVCTSHSQTAASVHFLEFTATLHGRAPPTSFLS
ncbi:MAG TPA: DUF2946 family protein [Pyrinomonadaceae bacterium]|nr:DUF2946 family protein [Pyrinomonadaceae bacterium]